MVQFINGFTDSEEEAFLNLFPFLWCQFFSKNVSEKLHVFCLQTRIQSERTSEHAARGGLILNGFSLGDATRESDKDDNWGCGGRWQQSADSGKQNWRAEMRR
jgi:hypothetical protein